MACRVRLAGLVVGMLLLVGCARQGGGGESGASLCSEPGVGNSREASGARVRVMTYNVNWGAPGVEQTLGAIREAGVDVVCLQETTGVWEEHLRAGLSGEYPHMLFRHHLFPSGGMAVLSRWPVREGAYVQPLGGWFPAWVVWAETPVGELQMVVVHLHPPVPSAEGMRHLKGVRRDEIKSLLAHVEPERATVILGDFNESRQGWAVGHLLERGYIDAMPVWEQAGSGRGGPTTAAVGLAVDHILYSGHLECHGAAVLNRGGSDHLPVVAVLRRRGSDPQAARGDGR